MPDPKILRNSTFSMVSEVIGSPSVPYMCIPKRSKPAFNLDKIILKNQKNRRREISFQNWTGAPKSPKCWISLTLSRTAALALSRTAALALSRTAALALSPRKSLVKLSIMLF